MIKTTFYITESTVYKNRTLYFRQDDWAQLSRPLIESMKRQMFDAIPSVRFCMAQIRFKLTQMDRLIFSLLYTVANWDSLTFACCPKRLESGLSSTSQDDRYQQS